MPFVLLVNPWIMDFAAYDLWSKPLGLLYLGALLKDAGFDVQLIDCLDRYSPFLTGDNIPIPGKDRFYGTGKYPKTPVEMPDVYGNHPRVYYRYGLSSNSFQKALIMLSAKPDLILVTSIMTYWYPGVIEAIKIIKGLFPQTPLWLGGIYPKLCKRHAERFSGADRVITEPLSQLPELIESTLQWKVHNKAQWSHFSLFPPPLWDLYQKRSYGVLLTSLGCPFRCPYCASSIVQPASAVRPWHYVWEELEYHYEKNIRDFAFYDDALLIKGWNPLEQVLKRVVKGNLSVRFHAPNALHINALDEYKSALLYEAGLTTIRLGLETIQHHRKWGSKTENDRFINTVKILHKTGWKPEDIGVYLLCGVPGQTPQEVKASIDFVAKEGALPFIAEYSPIPGTALWKEACALSPFDLEKEPLYQNNSFFACRRYDFTYEDMTEIKNYARIARSLLTRTSISFSS